MNNSSTNLLNKRDEKIIIEKRRRHQTYVILDYLIYNNLYFFENSWA